MENQAPYPFAPAEAKSFPAEMLDPQKLFKSLRAQLRAEYTDPATGTKMCDEEHAVVNEKGYREICNVISLTGANFVGLLSNYPDKERWAGRIAKQVQIELIKRLAFNYRDWGVKKEDRNLLVWNIGFFVHSTILAATQGHLAKTVSGTLQVHEVRNINEELRGGGFRIPLIGGK